MTEQKVCELVRKAKRANRRAHKICGDAPVDIRLYADGTIKERDRGWYYEGDGEIIITFPAGCEIWDDDILEVHVREAASYVLYA